MRPMKLPRLFRPWMCPTMTRLGADRDGGYLVNRQDVMAAQRLISLGVGEDTSFERAFRELNPCPIDGYDHTVDHMVGLEEDSVTRFHSVQVGRGGVGVPDLIQPGETHVFVKADIEGAELDLLDDLVTHSDALVGLVVEMHRVCDGEPFEAVTNFISKFSLRLIHVHANNNSFVETPNGVIPDCLELTFSRGTNLQLWGATVPHPLDRPNTPQRPDFAISFA